MPFKPGQSGNPKGKPIGAFDKVPRKIKENFCNFLLKKATEANLEEVYKNLLPDERGRLLIAIAKMVIPSPPNITMNIDFEDLSQEQIEQIVEAMPEKKLDKLIERIQKIRK